MRIIVLTAVAAAVLAACGGGGDDPSMAKSADVSVAEAKEVAPEPPMTEAEIKAALDKAESERWPTPAEDPNTIVAKAAAVNAAKLPGLWSGRTEGAMSGPRTTTVLVEPSGDFWASYAWYGSGAPEAAGKVNVNTGAGVSLDYWSGYVPRPSTFTMKFDATVFSFIHNNVPYVGQPTEPWSRYEALVQHSLNRLPSFDTPMAAIKQTAYANSYSDEEPTYSITFGPGGAVTGFDGQCAFTGRLTDTANNYKRITYTFPSQCIRNSYDPVIPKGTSFTGVVHDLQTYSFNGVASGYTLFVKGRGQMNTDVRSLALRENSKLPKQNPDKGGIYSQSFYSTKGGASVLVIENDGRIWGSEYLYSNYQIEGNFYFTGNSSPGVTDTYLGSVTGMGNGPNGQWIDGKVLTRWLSLTGNPPSYIPQKEVKFNLGRSGYGPQYGLIDPNNYGVYAYTTDPLLIGSPLNNKHTWQGNWLQELALPTGMFKDMTAHTTLNVKADGKFSGTFGAGCTGNGNFYKTGKNYRRVDVTFTGDCYDQSGKPMPNNTRLVGVMPGTFFVWKGINYGAWVAILRSEQEVISKYNPPTSTAYNVTKTFLLCPAPAGSGYTCNNR